MTESERKAKLLSYVGFARKSGSVAVGSDAVLAEVRRGGKPPLVLIAADASERTKKQISDKCRYYKADLIEDAATGDELAAALGKSGREPAEKA